MTSLLITAKTTGAMRLNQGPAGAGNLAAMACDFTQP
jgi:hypothetical protein